MATSAAVLSQAVVPTARAIRWAPPLVLAGILVMAAGIPLYFFARKK